MSFSTRLALAAATMCCVTSSTLVFLSKPVSAGPCAPASPVELKAETAPTWDLSYEDDTQQQLTLEYRQATCDFGSGEIAGSIIGLKLRPNPDRVRLAFKSNHEATLIVDFAGNDLKPGRYSGSAVIRSQGISLVQPFKLTVTYKKPFWGWFTLIASCLIGSAVVALRAAVGTPSISRSWVRFYKPGASWIVMGFGIVAAIGVLTSQYLNASRAFSGKFTDFLLLGLQLGGAFVTAATTATVPFKGAANSDSGSLQSSKG